MIHPGFSIRSIYLGLLAILLAVVTLWVYWPGQYGPWLLDDRSSLLVLENIGDSWRGALDFILSDHSGPLGRTVSMTSFVLERWFLGDDIATGKLVNIFLHALNGMLLFWLFWILLSHHSIRKSGYLAIVAAGAWMLAPIHVSTVLYVVQRMAMLAATFSFGFLITYLYWRNSFDNRLKALLLSLLLIGLFLLAAFSKENAVIIIPIAVLMECFWLQGRCDNGRFTVPLLRTSQIMLVCSGLGSVFLLAYGWDWINRGYQIRHFDLHERLLTQARVLWDYIGQIVCPDLPRMGLFHDDYPVSKSLYQPSGTLVAVVGWLFVGLTIIGFSTRPFGRAVVFGLLWFLVAHLVESSVLALEIYFEHRNYLPSVGLYLFAALLIGKLFSIDARVAAPVLLWVFLYLVVTAAKTGSQVQIWSSAPLLRINHVLHHPQSSRANQEMAIHMAGVGALDSALEFADKAHSYSVTERVGDHQIFAIALHCLSNRALSSQSLIELGAKDPERPFAVVATMHGLFKTLQGHACSEFDRLALAHRFSEIFLTDPRPERAAPNMYLLLAGFENSLQRYQSAYDYTTIFLQLSSGSARGMLMRLHFAYALEKFDEIATLKGTLEKLDSAGKLNATQSKTLSFYN